MIQLSVQQSHVLLVGDFNAKHAAWFQHQPTDTEGDHLKTFTDGLNLHQLINSPTYNTTSDHPSLLDLIFTNRPAAVLSTATLPPVADHSPVLVHLSLNKAVSKKPYHINCFLYSDIDHESLHLALTAAAWPDLSGIDIDRAVVLWTDCFMSTCRRHVPCYQKRVDPSSKPWFSSYLLHLASWRDRLFRRSRGKPSASKVMAAFCSALNLFVVEMRAAELRYYRNLGCLLTSNAIGARKWWDIAKQACGWTSKRKMPSLLVNDAVLTSP